MTAAPPWDVQQSDGGLIAGFSLSSVLQLVQIERRSCTILVDGERSSGELVLSGGEIVYGATRDLTGSEAVLALLRSPIRRIQLREADRSPPRTVHAPLTQLLLEAVRREDVGTSATPPGRGTDSAANGTLLGAANVPWRSIVDDLQAALAIPGAMAVALVDLPTGILLAAAGESDDDLGVLAAGNAEVLRSRRDALSRTGATDEIEEIVLTLTTRYHLIRPLGSPPSTFLFLDLERAGTDLALAQHCLQRLAAALSSDDGANRALHQEKPVAVFHPAAGHSGGRDSGEARCADDTSWRAEQPR